VGSLVTTPSRSAGGRPVDGGVVRLGLVCEVVRGGVVRGAVVGRVVVVVRRGVDVVVDAVFEVVVLDAVTVDEAEAPVVGGVEADGSRPELHAARRSTATATPTRALLIPQD
jgi:hypothetical protein